MQSAKKMSIRSMTIKVQKIFNLNNQTLEELVRMLDKLDKTTEATAALTSWEFLLRVQSETIPLLAGTAQDVLALEAGKHSAVWYDERKKEIHLRLARRKHRLSGSHLTRRCSCSDVSRSLCVAHRLSDLLETKQPGHRLWNFEAIDLVKVFKRTLTLLGNGNVEAFTLKAFRKGKAIDMATKGSSLAKILEAGEWRSAAVFKYVNFDHVDAALFLKRVEEASDDEQGTADQ